MTKDELLNIETIIKEDIIKTEVSIANLKELTKPIPPENAIGRVSRMDAINNKSINEAALRKVEQKYKNLKIAISNINDPSFGICRKCNKPIPMGRIILMPQVNTCVNCSQ